MKPNTITDTLDNVLEKYGILAGLGAAVLLLAAMVTIIIAVPMSALWALQTLTSTGFAYSLSNWFAMFWLLILFQPHWKAT